MSTSPVSPIPAPSASLACNQRPWAAAGRSATHLSGSDPPRPPPQRGTHFTFYPPLNWPHPPQIPTPPCRYKRPAPSPPRRFSSPLFSSSPVARALPSPLLTVASCLTLVTALPPPSALSMSPNAPHPLLDRATPHPDLTPCYRRSPSPAMNSSAPPSIAASPSPEHMGKPWSMKACPMQPPPLPCAFPAGCAPPRLLCPHRASHHRWRAERGDHAGRHPECTCTGILGLPCGHRAMPQATFVPRPSRPHQASGRKIARHCSGLYFFRFPFRVKRLRKCGKLLKCTENITLLRKSRNKFL
jgi:hypothetical protein